MNTQPHDRFDAGGDDLPPPFAHGDEMDTLLRDWHQRNRDRAAAGRDRLLAALRAEDAAGAAATPAASLEFKPAEPAPRTGAGGRWVLRFAPLAIAALIALAFVAPFMLPPGPRGGGSVALASMENMVLCPEGGRLEAYDAAGEILGPCELKHTDVAAEITGHVARVTLTQTFHNPHKDKIEAVYTFPMSHRGAVDRMSMTIGDRVIVGEVKERDRAREIYEAARDQGLVAALTEQERPNIFTQSVANIEPGATIAVTLSYVEFVEEKDGEFSFTFPTVVGPRYIPGTPTTGDRPPALPDGLKLRRGLVLLAPASIEYTDRGPGFARSERNPDITLLAAAIRGAAPIQAPESVDNPDRWLGFDVRYADGTTEQGMFYLPSTGHIGGRWFTIAEPVFTHNAMSNPREAAVREGAGHDADQAAVSPLPEANRTPIEPGAAFAADTDQVPDASRISPMPVPPGTRAGHDLSITVTINTGGPGILEIESPLHKTIRTDTLTNDAGLPRKSVVALQKLETIPNRDFVLSWKQSAEEVTDQVFTHTGDHGNFFALMLRPPARVDDAMAVPRELVFVLDTSGSMSGFPMEKSREVVDKALSTMRENDTFNVITFSGTTRVLWPEPRQATTENIAAARQLLTTLQGGGGTEMMTAINAALTQAPIEEDRVRPLRIAMFFTDGFVGNDVAIIDAVKRNRGTTRVFSFGIGNSVNRYLLDTMALEGGGAAEFVLLESDADAAVERLTRRTRTPVLTDIRVEFAENLSVLDVLPSLDNIPDLFDEQPLVILGRYTAPGAGTVVLRGNNAAGPWERTLTLSLPEKQPEHDTIATMWARAKIDQIKSRDLAGVQHGTLAAELQHEIVRLGEQFGIMSEYTSFVAVDKLRVTIAGKPRLVSVPIELPAGTDYSGFFGEGRPIGDETWTAKVSNVEAEVPPIMRVDVQAAGQSRDDLVQVRAAFNNPAEAAAPAAAAGRELAERIRERAEPAPSSAAPAPMPAVTAAAPAAPAAGSRQTRTPPAAKPQGQRGAGTGGESVSSATSQESRGRGDSNLQAAGRPVETENMRRNTVARVQTPPKQNDAMLRSFSAAPSLQAPTTELYVLLDQDRAQTQLGYVADELARNSVPVLIKDAPTQQMVNRIVPREQVVLRVAQLSQQNLNDQARELACGLAQAAPDYPVAVDLCNVLNETKAPPEMQLKQVAGYAEQARRDLQDLARRAELRRRLDERLWLYVFGENAAGLAQIQLGTEVTSCNNLPAPEARQIAASAGFELVELGNAEKGLTGDVLGALVTVLVADTGEATLARLREAGLRVETTAAAANIVIGVIPLGKLGELALVEGVRRVEPMARE